MHTTLLTTYNLYHHHSTYMVGYERVDAKDRLMYCSHLARSFRKPQPQQPVGNVQVHVQFRTQHNRPILPFQLPQVGNTAAEPNQLNDINTQRRTTAVLANIAESIILI